MNLFGIVILIALLGVVPIAIGCIPASYLDKKNNSIAFMWVTGLLFMWAGFQFICVPLILTESVGEEHFPLVVYAYTAYLTILTLVGVIYGIRNGFWQRKSRRFSVLGENTAMQKLLWCTALLLIAIQVVLAVVLVYSDGDDAYYVAVSTLTESSDTMYKISPYSIGQLELDERHGLAPFPIWIAYLARVSGLSTALVAHSIVAPVLIACTYVIYYLIAGALFKAKKETVPLFLAGMSLFVLFGDYSSYTAENFMLARSRQGKAAIGNIVIPVIFYLLLVIMQRLRDEKRTEWMWYVLLTCAVTTACLCTTLGAFLSSLLVAIVGIVAAVTFRCYRILWKWAVCCVPAVLFAILYIMIG